MLKIAHCNYILNQPKPSRPLHPFPRALPWHHAECVSTFINSTQKKKEIKLPIEGPSHTQSETHAEGYWRDQPAQPLNMYVQFIVSKGMEWKKISNYCLGMSREGGWHDYLTLSCLSQIYVGQMFRNYLSISPQISEPHQSRPPEMQQPKLRATRSS